MLEKELHINLYAFLKSKQKEKLLEIVYYFSILANSSTAKSGTIFTPELDTTPLTLYFSTKLYIHYSGNSYSTTQDYFIHTMN